MKKRIFKKSNKGRREDGQSLIVAAIFLTVLVLFMSLVIDYGVAYHKKATFQTALDSASLAISNDSDFKGLSVSNSNNLSTKIVNLMKQNGFEYEFKSDDASKQEVKVYNDKTRFENDTKNISGQTIYCLFDNKESTDTVQGYVEVTLKGSFTSHYVFGNLISADAYNTVCEAQARANYYASGNPDAIKYQFLAFGGSDSHFNITGPVENTWMKNGLNWLQKAINGGLDFVWNNNNSWLKNWLGGTSSITCDACGYSGLPNTFTTVNGLYKCPKCGNYNDRYDDSTNVASVNMTTSACVMNGHVHSNGVANVDIDTFRMASFIIEPKYLNDDNYKNKTLGEVNADIIKNNKDRLGQDADLNSDPGALYFPTISVSTDTTGINLTSDNNVGQGVFLTDFMNLSINSVISDLTPNTKKVTAGNVDLTPGKTYQEYTDQEQTVAKCWDYCGRISHAAEGEGLDLKQLYYNKDTISDPGFLKYIKKRYKDPTPSMEYLPLAEANAQTGVEDTEPVVSFVPAGGSFVNDTSNISNGSQKNVNSQKINPVTLLDETPINQNGENAQNAESNLDKKNAKVLPSAYETFNNSFNFKYFSTDKKEKDDTGSTKNASIKQLISGKINVAGVVGIAKAEIEKGLKSPQFTEDGDLREIVHDTVFKDLTDLEIDDDHSIENAEDPTNKTSIREALPIGSDIRTIVNKLKTNFSSQMSIDYVNQNNSTKTTVTPTISTTDTRSAVSSKYVSMYNDTYLSGSSLTKTDVNNISYKKVPSSTSGYTFSKSDDNKQSGNYFLDNYGYFGNIERPKADTTHNHFVVIRPSYTCYITGTFKGDSKDTYNIGSVKKPDGNYIEDHYDGDEHMGLFMESGTAANPTTLFVGGDMNINWTSTFTMYNYCSTTVNGSIYSNDSGTLNVGDNSILVVEGNIGTNDSNAICGITLGNNSTIVVKGDLRSCGGSFNIGTNSKVIVGGKVVVNGRKTLNIGSGSVVQADYGFDCSNYWMANDGNMISSGTINTGAGNSNTFGNVYCESNIYINGSATFNGRADVLANIYVSSAVNVNGIVVTQSYLKADGLITVAGKLCCNGATKETDLGYYSIYASAGMTTTGNGTVFSYRRLYSKGTLTFVDNTEVYCNDAILRANGGDIYAPGCDVNIKNSSKVFCFGRVESTRRDGLTAGKLNMSENAELYSYGCVRATNGDNGEMNIDHSSKIYIVNYNESALSLENYPATLYGSGRIELSVSATSDNPLKAAVYCDGVYTEKFFIIQGNSELYCNGDFEVKGSNDSDGAYTVKDAGPSSQKCSNLWVMGNIKLGSNKLNLQSFANVYCEGSVYCGEIYTQKSVNMFVNNSINCSDAGIYSSNIYCKGSFIANNSVTIGGENDTHYFGNLNCDGDFQASSLTLKQYSRMYIAKNITVNGDVKIGDNHKDNNQSTIIDPIDSMGIYLNGSVYCGGRFVCTSNLSNNGYIYINNSNVANTSGENSSDVENIENDDKEVAGGNALEVTGTISLDDKSKLVTYGDIKSLIINMDNCGSLYCDGNIFATSTGAAINYSGSISSNSTKVSSCYSRFYCTKNIISSGSINVYGLSDEDYSAMFAIGYIKVAQNSQLLISECSVVYCYDLYLGEKDESGDSVIRGILYVDDDINGFDSQTRVINIAADISASISFDNKNEIPITYANGDVYLGDEKKDSSYPVTDLSKQKVRVTYSQILPSASGYAYYVKKGEGLTESSLNIPSGNVLIEGNLTVEHDFTINSDGKLFNHGTLIVNGDLYVDGYLENKDGTIIVTGNIHVNGRRGKTVNVMGIAYGDYSNEGIYNGWVNPSSKGYIYCGGNLSSKFSCLNLQGQMYVGGSMNCAIEEADQNTKSGWTQYYGVAYEGGNNSAVFVGGDFKCLPQKGVGSCVVRKNALLYCQGDMEVSRTMNIGNMVSDSKDEPVIETQQYSEMTSNTYSGFTKYPVPAYKDSNALESNAKLVVDSTAGDAPDNSIDVDDMYNNYIGIYKSKAELIGKYVIVAKNVKQGYAVSDYGMAFIRGSLKVPGVAGNGLRVYAKSILYVENTNDNDSSIGSDFQVKHQSDAITTNYLYFFPYSRIYCGGNLTTTSSQNYAIFGTSTSIVSSWNSMVYVKGNLTSVAAVKMRGGCRCVIGNNFTSGNWIELGKERDDTHDESDDPYLLTQFYIGGDLTAKGYIKQYARSKIVAGGNVNSTSSITMRHHSTLRVKGNVTATTTFDGGSYSHIYVGGTLKTYTGPIKIRDACSTYIYKDLQSPTYIELGKHEDKEYKYNDWAKNKADSIQDYENPNNDVNTDGSAIVTNEKPQCPDCGSTDVNQADANSDSYTCNNCGRVFSSDECYENDPALGGYYCVGGSVKALTGYLRIYAKSQLNTANTVNIYSYITLRHDAGLSVKHSNADDGIVYSYNHDNGRLLDSNAASVDNFYVDTDKNSPGFGKIYYLQGDKKYYGFYLNTATNNADANGDGVADFWLYQGQIYTYTATTANGKTTYSEYYGPTATDTATINGVEQTVQYTKSYFYVDGTGIKESASYAEVNGAAADAVDSTVLIGGASRVFTCFETSGNVFALGDLTVGGGAHIYSSGNVTSYGKTTVNKDGVIYAVNDFKSSCSLSIASLFAGSTPCGLELNHGAIVTKNGDIDIDSTSYMTGGVIDAGKNVTFDSIYSYYKYANTYTGGTNAYKNQAKNIDMIICAEDGNVSLNCVYNYGGGLTYAPNGNIKTKGIFYDYYGSMMATNVDVNAFYINMHRMANADTLDLEFDTTGRSYLVK